MDRRSFLAAAGASGLTAASAGCLGYTVKKTAEVDRLKRESRQKSDRIDALQGNITELEGELETLDAEVDSLESTKAQQADRIDRLEADVDAAADKQVLYLYGYAITHYNNGRDFFERAQNRDSDAYDAARADLNAAAGYFSSATSSFGGAADRASDLDLGDVTDWCRAAESKASAFTSACSSYQIAMYYYQNDQDSRGDEKLQAGEEQFGNAQDYEIKDRSALETELGTSIDTE